MKHPEGKVPPQNIEAEQSVLGAIMGANDILDEIVEILHPEHFYRSAHQKIYQAILELDKKQEPIDIITLNNHLKQKDQLENVGDTSYITYLSSSVPTAANAVYYANIVHDKAILRKVISVSTSLIGTAHTEPDDVGAFVDKAEQALFEIDKGQQKKELTLIKNILPKSIKVIEDVYNKPDIIIGVSTGFKELDDLTAGCQPADLIIIAGRPSMGKTALALNIANNAALYNGLSVAIFSLEMSKEKLATRLLCSESEINSNKIRTGNLSSEEFPKMIRAAGRLTETKIYMDDKAAITATEIRSKCRRLKAQGGLDMVIIDYLQLMGNDYSSRDSVREQEVAKITRALKALAKEVNVPVIALSQLNRNLESRTDKRPKLSDLRESGAIEQDADVIIFVYRDEVYDYKTDDKGIAELIVGKQRDGETDTVKLRFIKEYTKFKEIPGREQEDFYYEDE
jgi:replicative DNA helicase